MNRLFYALLFGLILLTGTANALDLQSAKAQGLVGETASGYLAAVQGATPAVDALVAEINNKRKTHYQNIASSNNTPLATVEQLAGQKAMEKTPAGQYINSGSGWQKK